MKHSEENIVDGLKYTTIKDKDGNVIDPNKIVLDPVWVAHMEDPDQVAVDEIVGIATGEDYHPEEVADG